MSDDLVMVNFYIPRPLLSEFDGKIKARYNNRTQAILELIRDFCEKMKEAGKQP